jgi:choline monooxygenase
LIEQPEISLRDGGTLPGSWYVDDEIFQREIENIFDRVWHYVGFRGHVSRPGDFLTTTVGLTPVVVTCGDDGVVRAFLNVCRHRGSEVVREPFGQRKTLQCHYHAWTYDLDGSLRKAPRSEDEEGFDPSAFGLRPIRIAFAGAWVFVTLNDEAPELDTLIGEMLPLMKDTSLDFDQLVFRERREYDMAANWKVVIENFLECYHCPTAHPSFTKLIDLDDYEMEIHDAFSTFNGPVTDAALQKNTYHVTDEDTSRQRLYNFAMWPNFMFNAYPGPGNVSTNLVIPINPNRTLAIYDFFFEPHVEDAAAGEIVDFIDLVQQEDIILCESVQKGMRSTRFGQGRLFVKSEFLIQNFDRQVEAAVSH